MTTSSTSPATKYKRVLLKLSGEACQGADKRSSLDPQQLAAMAKQVEKTLQLGVEVAIVVGGGNIFRGLAGMNRGIERTNHGRPHGDAGHGDQLPRPSIHA